MVPKQVIYPIRYISPLFRQDGDLQEKLFLERFATLLRLPLSCLPLGRARAGIQLLTKTAITKDRPLVLLSPYTIPDVVNMIRFAGGTPTFIDHEPRSTHLDLNQLEDALTDRVACVWVTHYHVNQHPMAEIRSICAARGARLFEDCAIALGGTIDAHSVGLHSDAGVFSLSAYKSLNYFWGGAIVTHDADLWQSIAKTVKTWRRLRFSDYSPQIIRTLKYDLATRRGVFDCVAAPLLRHRQRRFGVSIGLSQPRIESVAFDDSLRTRPSAGAFAEWNHKIDQVNANLLHRRRIAIIYDQSLSEWMVSENSPEEIRRESCFVNYPVWIGQERRDEVYKTMLCSRYDVGLSLYPNVHHHPEFTALQGHSKCVTSLTNSVISLPTHPRVSPNYAVQLADFLKRHL